jgi:hypothetical protein
VTWRNWLGVALAFVLLLIPFLLIDTILSPYRLWVRLVQDARLELFKASLGRVVWLHSNGQSNSVDSDKKGWRN